MNRWINPQIVSALLHLTFKLSKGRLTTLKNLNRCSLIEKKGYLVCGTYDWYSTYCTVVQADCEGVICGCYGVLGVR